MEWEMLFTTNKNMSFTPTDCRRSIPKWLNYDVGERRNNLRFLPSPHPVSHQDDRS
jgi:hypothetical protein